MHKIFQHKALYYSLLIFIGIVLWNIINWTPEIITILIFLLSVIFWIFNILPIPITGILMIILFVISGVLTIEEALIGLGNEIVWVVLGVLILGIAFEKTGLEKRITYFLLSLAKGNLVKLLFYFISSGFILTFFIPNAVARLSLMYAIAQGIHEQFSLIGKENNSKAFYLSVIYAPYITTISLITAASGSIYAVGLFLQELRYEWNYLYWFILMFPITVGSIFTLWFILKRDLLIEISDQLGLEQYFLKKRKELGKISEKEIKMLVLYSSMFILWITSKYTQLPFSLPALISMIVLFVPKMNVIEWKDVKGSFDWGILILFSAGMALANAFSKSGLSLFISDGALKIIEVIPFFLFPILMVLLIVIIRLMFTNFNAMIAAILPIIISLSGNMQINPIWLTLLAVVSCSIGYILPTQSFGCIMIYSTGRIKFHEISSVGTVLSIGIIIVALLSAYLYWPIMGVPVTTRILSNG